MSVGTENPDHAAFRGIRKIIVHRIVSLWMEILFGEDF